MNKQRTLLLVEDDEKIMAINRRALKTAGHHLLEAEDLATAREHLARSVPDLIILDIVLPDGNGLDFIPEIREITTAPILLLTALGKVDEKVEGLRAGGDDYIAKPYNINELRERVAAFIRRSDMMPEKLTLGPLTMDLTAQRAFLSGKDMLLTQKEFAILHLLVKKVGEVVKKDYIYQKVWGEPVLNDKCALYSHINRLKRKLEKHESFELCLSWKEGYCLNYLP